MWMERAWAAYLGCAASDLRRSGVWVTAHPHECAGAYVLRHRSACIVAAPLHRFKATQTAFAGVDVDTAFREAGLRAAFGTAFERLIGPAYLGLVTPDAYCPSPVAGVRPLAPADRPAVQRLQSACEGTEWEHGGPGPNNADLYGCFRDGDLTCLGSLEAWGAGVLHLSVVTHPAFRGQGLARGVVSALTEETFRRGQAPQYRALLNNHASMAVARRLGYREWGRMSAVRLHS